MARPRGERQGKRVTIYLTPDRLDRVGWDEPADAIYDLIDSQEIKDAPKEEVNGSEE